MNISGIRPFSGFYDYNTIKAAAETGTSVQQAAKAESAPETVAAPAEKPIERAPKEQNFDAYDYAQFYRPDEKPEMKGADSDILSLDMEKAISDMRKDQVLQQYQFFVGTKEATETVAAASENFDL